jgi:hypothetical protein
MAMVPASPSITMTTSSSDWPLTARASKPASLSSGPKWPPTLESIKVSVSGEIVPTMNLPVPGNPGSLPSGPLAITRMFSGLS